MTWLRRYTLHYDYIRHLKTLHQRHFFVLFIRVFNATVFNFLLVDNTRCIRTSKQPKRERSNAAITIGTGSRRRTRRG